MKHSFEIARNLFLLILWMTQTLAFSQSTEDASRKNAVKLNILPPLLSATGELSYERLVTQNVSLVLGLGGNIRADQSDFQLNSDANLEFLNRDIQNYYLLAELRRYIQFCDCQSPHGFYAGGFVRYNSLSYTSNPQFTSGNTQLEFNMELNLRALNFGPVLGYQINLHHWLIDFEFGGFGYTPKWISYHSDTELSSEALAHLSDALSQNFGIGGRYKEIELTSSSGKTHFWYWTIRYAVSVGYNF